MARLACGESLGMGPFASYERHRASFAKGTYQRHNCVSLEDVFQHLWLGIVERAFV